MREDHQAELEAAGLVPGKRIDTSTVGQVLKKNSVNLADFEVLDEDEEVTVAAYHRVRWECSIEFNRWVEEMAIAMSKSDGFMGSDVFHDESPNGPYNPEHVTLFR